MRLSRREFALGVAGAAAGSRAWAQAQPEDLWGGPVVDCHHHLRRSPEANVAHLNGCGVSHAVLLAGAGAAEQVKVLMGQNPGRFLAWSASVDVTKPDAEQVLSAAVRSGAVGLGELKNHVKADGPELRRLYALAGELGVPILVHFQEVPHTPTEGVFATGFKQFETVLKAYPKTRFIGHADAFWANISADYAEQAAYPSGPVKRGGVTDKLLGDYANLFGDLSANSGNNALSRDPDFTVGFLARHQDKLIFGSDCGCTDGKGGGTSQAGNPGASRLAGKCVARETLTLLKKTVSPAAFRKLAGENGRRVFQVVA